MIFWCKNVTNRQDPFGAERKFFGAEQYFSRLGSGALWRPCLTDAGMRQLGRHVRLGENTILHQKNFFLHQTGHDGFSRFRTKKLFLICTKCFFRTFTISHQNYTPEQQKVTNLHQIQAKSSSQLFLFRTKYIAVLSLFSTKIHLLNIIRKVFYQH